MFEFVGLYGFELVELRGWVLQLRRPKVLTGNTHPAPSRALARGGVRAFRHRPAGRNDPRSVARRPLPRLRHRTGHGVLRHLKRPAAPECASRTPCSAAPSPPAAVFDFRAHFCHSAPMETHAFGFRLRANAPEGQKRFPISPPNQEIICQTLIRKSALPTSETLRSTADQSVMTGAGGEMHQTR